MIYEQGGRGFLFSFTKKTESTNDIDIYIASEEKNSQMNGFLRGAIIIIEKNTGVCVCMYVCMSVCMYGWLVFFGKGI